MFTFDLVSIHLSARIALKQKSNLPAVVSKTITKVSALTSLTSGVGGFNLCAKR